MGRALLRSAEAEARRRGGRLLLVETSSTPEYGLARRLYERSGYHLEAVVHDFYAPGDDLVIYARDLVEPDAERSTVVVVDSELRYLTLTYPA